MEQVMLSTKFWPSSSDQDKMSFAFHNENMVFLSIMKMKLILLYNGWFYHKNGVDANLSRCDADSCQVQSLTVIAMALEEAQKQGVGLSSFINAKVLVSSGSTHSLRSASLRVHSWVYGINALGRRRGSRKVFFP